MRPAAYRIHTSAPIERAFQRDKSWQHPGRREHIHGRVQPLQTSSRVPAICNAIVIALFVAAAALCVSKGWSW